MRGLAVRLDRLAPRARDRRALGLDTRSLVLRSARAARCAAVSPVTLARRGAARGRAQPPMAGRALVPTSRPRAVRLLRQDARASPSSTTAASARSCASSPARAPRSPVFPHDVPADELATFDGVLLTNGPGDPEPLVDEVAVLRELLGRVPVLGICLGHQLLGLAADTRRASSASDTAARTTRCSSGDGRGARHEPEPRVRASRRPTTRRRRTSRCTTARSRASTSRAPRGPCSSTPRRAQGRTTRGRSSASGSRS